MSFCRGLRPLIRIRGVEAVPITRRERERSQLGVSQWGSFNIIERGGLYNGKLQCSWTTGEYHSCYEKIMLKFVK